MYSDKIPCFKIGDIIQCSKKSKYIVDGYLGQGRYGKVYKVIPENRREKSPNACKIQSDKYCHESNIHRLLKHKHIVKLLYSYCSAKYCYIFMEYCQHGTLFDFVRDLNGLTVPETRCFYKQIVVGVKYLHEMKIIHRDLKLNNILLAHQFQIKISDFGLAKFMTGPPTAPTKLNQNMERHHYYAPELFNGQAFSAASDIWAMGVCLYKMVFRRNPFKINENFMVSTKFPITFGIVNNDDLFELLKNIFQPVSSRFNAADCLNSKFCQ